MKTRRAGQFVFGLLLVLAAYWNLWSFTWESANRPTRESDEVSVIEDRYRGIRNMLNVVGYPRGPILFFTNGELKLERIPSENQKRWAEAQYVMVPWILIHNGRTAAQVPVDTDAPFAIGDFGAPELVEIPEGLVKIYDTQRGVVLFRRKLDR
jgi:hypothetical protein